MPWVFDFLPPFGVSARWFGFGFLVMFDGVAALTVGTERLRVNKKLKKGVDLVTHGVSGCLRMTTSSTGRRSMTTGVSFSPELLRAARKAATADRRTLSSYIQWLVTKDLRELKGAK